MRLETFAAAAMSSTVTASNPRSWKSSFATRSKVSRDAAFLSGGLPRVFLQLLADAATYALMNNGGEWPEKSNLDDAITDHQEGMRRGLLPGDLQLIRAAEGTQGLELPVDAKVRLLAHGLLLERQTLRGVLLQPHPLLRPLLSEG